MYKDTLGLDTQNISFNARKTYAKFFILGFAVLFLSTMLVNSVGRESNILTLGYFPSVTKTQEPFVVTATVNNPTNEPQLYGINIYVDDAPVLVTESKLDASSSQAFTYTCATPELGTAMRIYAEVVKLETGAKYSEVLLVPPSPPETWMSFAAFSSIATSLTSTTSSLASSSSSLSSSSSSSSMSSTFTVSYYLSTMSIATMLQQPQYFAFPINVGLNVSISLIGLLIFIELTNQPNNTLGTRVAQLRGRYKLLAASLLLIFVGMVLTQLIMLLV